MARANGAAASRGQGCRVAGLQGCRAGCGGHLVDGAGDSLGEAEQRRPVLVGRSLHAEGGEVGVAAAVALHAHGAHGQQRGRDGRAFPAGARRGELRRDRVERRRDVPARPKSEVALEALSMRFGEALGRHCGARAASSAAP